MVGVWLSLLMLLSLLSVQDPAQNPKPPQDQSAQDQSAQDQGYRIGVAVNQVFLSVNVRSVSGGFVKNLTKDDFLVFEDGRLQKIVNFYSEKVPVKVVLLIDASGSTRFSQVDIRNAALEFVKGLGPEDQVAVITFNDQVKLILDFTSNLDDIKLALESIYAKGSTVLNDAVYVTFDDLLKNVQGKTAVILLTDGIDTGSTVSFDSAMNLALRSDTVVYVASKVDEYRQGAIEARQQFAAHAQMIPKELQDDYIVERKAMLQRLTDLTGGRLLDTFAFYSLTNVYQQVAEELRNQYYISYTPTNQARDGSWRSIDLKTTRGGLVVSTRKGYFAPGGAGQPSQ
ncbi:MAG: VWA domain-containing protein [Acidobacteriota bacterium]